MICQKKIKYFKIIGKNIYLSSKVCYNKCKQADLTCDLPVNTYRWQIFCCGSVTRDKGMNVFHIAGGGSVRGVSTVGGSLFKLVEMV